MPTVGEVLGAGNSQMQAALDAGVDAISSQQNVLFTQYQKFVFSQDGSVFWVKTATTLNVTGALHYATDRMQVEDETAAHNQVFLTAEIEVSQFNATSPTTMWVGAWPVGDGLTIQVVFGRRGGFFGPAELWHYSGIAVLPALSAQLVNDASDLPQGPIVSNSLPIWILLAPAGVPVVPSFLVPDNLVPPYIVAHVEPTGTQTLAAAPILSWPGTTVPNSGASPFHDLPSSQLCRDEVELVLYGFTNQQAIQYQWRLMDASVNLAIFGFANSPAIVDEKRPQVEIAALSMKKTIHVSANYYQTTADAIAYRLILEAFVSSLTAAGGNAPTGQAVIFQDAQTVTAVGTVTE